MIALPEMARWGVKLGPLALALEKRCGWLLAPDVTDSTDDGLGAIRVRHRLNVAGRQMTAELTLDVFLLSRIRAGPEALAEKIVGCADAVAEAGWAWAWESATIPSPMLSR